MENMKEDNDSKKNITIDIDQDPMKLACILMFKLVTIFKSKGLYNSVTSLLSLSSFFNYRALAGSVTIYIQWILDQPLTMNLPHDFIVKWGGGVKGKFGR